MIDLKGEDKTAEVTNQEELDLVTKGGNKVATMVGVLRVGWKAAIREGEIDKEVGGKAEAFREEEEVFNNEGEFFNNEG